MTKAFLIRRKRRVDGRPVAAKTWSIRYRLRDGAWKDRPLQVRDKQVAEKLLSEFIVQCEQEAAGVVPPKAMREGLAKSLSDHLAEFVQDLAAKGRARKYVYNLRKLCGRLFTGCNWTMPGEVTSDGFMVWRAGQTRLAAKTLNEYLNAANALFNWMARHGRVLSNPLRSVEKVDTRGREKRKRRALTVEECRRLLALTTPHRAVYVVALATGLRRAELAALTWADVREEALRPFVRVRASVAKNRRMCNQPLTPDAVAVLKQMRGAGESVTDGGAVFPAMPTMEEFRADLDAATISHAADAQGRVVDFHSLRHTLATMLSLSHVSPREAMEIMRHSDLRLTMKTYTDAGQLAVGDALDKLPSLSAVALDRLAVAVGGESLSLGSSSGSPLTNTLTHGLVGTSLDTSGQQAEEQPSKSDNRPEKPGESLRLSSDVAKCPNTAKSSGKATLFISSRADVWPDPSSLVIRHDEMSNL